MVPGVTKVPHEQCAALRAALLHTPPLELLGRDAPLAQAVARALQLTGVLLVPEADRGAALQRPTAPRS